MMKSGMHYGVSRRGAEIGFALLTLIVGAVMLAGVRELETGWDDGSPQAGYFPLRIGLVIVVASLVNLLLAVKRSRHKRGN